jgi:hypothetical protein
MVRDVLVRRQSAQKSKLDTSINGLFSAPLILPANFWQDFLSYRMALASCPTGVLHNLLIGSVENVVRANIANVKTASIACIPSGSSLGREVAGGDLQE